ncbi:hypothetical protein [Pseudoflavitalea sp. G-6-1-2]|nr:hypothetical protein [Pseudoflavitalea sp. G-6-1-2]
MNKWLTGSTMMIPGMRRNDKARLRNGTVLAENSLKTAEKALKNG